MLKLTIFFINRIYIASLTLWPQFLKIVNYEDNSIAYTAAINMIFLLEILCAI